MLKPKRNLLGGRQISSKEELREIVARKAKAIRRAKRKCGKCGQPGHTAKTCKLVIGRANNAPDREQEDEAV